MHSTPTDINVHLNQTSEPDIRCRTLAPPDGKPFAILTIGPASIYPTLDQLAAIRSVIDRYLSANGMPLDDGFPRAGSSLADRQRWAAQSRMAERAMAEHVPA